MEKRAAPLIGVDERRDSAKSRGANPDGWQLGTVADEHANDGSLRDAVRFQNGSHAQAEVFDL